ncbi:MAG: ABC transporter permease [Anaerolineales bacterium]
MKALQIAIKDMKQAFRSLFAIAFMFVIPILMTAMFALLFGGTSSEENDASFELSVIPVQLVNLDEGQMGGILAELLRMDALTDLIAVTPAEDAETARRAVDAQEAQVAIIIPADFSAALFSGDAQTKIELYQDPTVTLGPGIVATLVEQFTISFSGSSILTEVAGTQLSERGYTLTPEQQQVLLMAYTQDVQQIQGESNMLRAETPAGEAQQTGGIAGVLGMIMGGMMIFYAFFTGTYASNTILKEEEEGTLARLFSTATARSEVIFGKLLAAMMMIVVQINVLVVFGWLVFDIKWGNLGMVVLFSLATTVAAATFGLFAISFAKDRKQAGVIIGAGVTITGMLGMSGIFMLSSPTPNQTITNLSLAVPQGWANQALIAMADAQPAGEVFLYLAGLLAWSAVMFFFGFRRFQKRFV